jgi:hypothetical protein
MLHFRAALRYNQAATNDFMAFVAKIEGTEGFFAPENMQRIFKQAQLGIEQSSD